MAEYTVLSPQTCILSPSAKIGRGAVIWPNNVLLGDCMIGEGAVLYPGNLIEDSSVGAGAVLTASVIKGSQVGAGAKIGPFAHLRPGSQVGENCRVGSFVEVKASRLGRGVRAGHLAYIGDADVGENTNIGCGVVFCNYDGTQKHRAQVGEACFIGSNVNLVAPVHLGDGCYIAAGTTLSGEVPARSFAVARARAAVRPDERGLYRPARESAPGGMAAAAEPAGRPAGGCGCGEHCRRAGCACGGEGKAPAGSCGHSGREGAEEGNAHG